MKRSRPPSKKATLYSVGISKSFGVREGSGAYVTDTPPLIWHLWGAPRLSGAARQIFEGVDRGEAVMYVPTICLVETVFLAEAGKIPERSYDRLLEFSRKGDGEGSYRIVPLSLETIGALRAVPRTVIRELSDRLIAATAHQLGLPLITKDEAIRQWTGLSTIW